MANLRVFVSSTAYDLSILRSSLRGFIERLGYEAILSDYSDILYDPREHAHKSCLAEVQNCDAVVLVVGSRFGTQLADDVLCTSLDDLDLKRFLNGDSGAAVSVTQAETLVAVGHGIPLFAFVDAAVHHDYSVYQRNQDRPFVKEIVYPSISQPGTAEHVFNFIRYLEGRSYNNAVITFERLEDVVGHLQKQWAALFQRLLRESRTRREEAVRIDRLADQFEDLKAALLTTVGDADSRKVARAVIKFRRLVDFVRSLPSVGTEVRQAMVNSDYSWSNLLREVGGVIKAVSPDEEVKDSRETRFRPFATILYTEDGNRFMCRFSLEVFRRLEMDWQDYRGLQPAEREVVYEALSDTDVRTPRLVYPIRQHESAEPEPSLMSGLPDESSSDE